MLTSFAPRSVEFHEHLTSEARELYKSLDETHQKRARQLAENMPNVVQAIFLAAQEAIASEQSVPPHSSLNTKNSEEKKRKHIYNPVRGPVSPRSNDRTKPYTHCPGALRHQ